MAPESTWSRWLLCAYLVLLDEWRALLKEIYMKTKFNRKLERGQIMPIVAIGMFTLLAMAVLLIDVGALYVNRRKAQNAADAGALAGARVLCQNNGATNEDILVAVAQYVTDNAATIVSSEIITKPGDMAPVPGLVKGEVVVTTEVEHASFFATIFGSDLLTAEATAGAGCFSVKTSNTLPIAWSCRPPVGGSESTSCDIVKLDFQQVADVANRYLSFPSAPGVTPSATNAKAASQALFDTYPGYIYIIMDSDKTCSTSDSGSGDLNCDVFSGDGGGRDNLKTGGERGWLNLNFASSNAQSKLLAAIQNGVDNPAIHIWYSGIDGERTPNYKALNDRVFDLVWIPVFNYICDTLPSPGSSCYNAAHNGTSDIPPAPLPAGTDCGVAPLNSGAPYYHVVGYAPFVITCAQAGKMKDCPGSALAASLNPSINANSTKTVEGYFFNPESLGELVGDGVDLGIYTVSLTR